MNFSSVSDKSILGKIMRFPLRLLPMGMIVPILQGKLTGKRWIVGSSNHGCWLGSYEYEKQALFAEIVSEGSVVYDIGAHVGFYTLLASEVVGQRGIVIAFEPLPRNLHHLYKHLSINKCGNVEVIEAAVDEESGTALFTEGINSSMGHLSITGNVEVKKVTLDELVIRERIPPPDYLKIDVEGSELMVLSGAKKMLHNFAPTIFLATHGVGIHRQCCEFLKSLEYSLQSIGGKSIYDTDEILACKKL